MRIRFWGVRGSLPAPLGAPQVREKLSAILRQALPGDLADPESRARFMAGLPPWLFGTVGGNTSCVGVDIDGFDERIVFDCGSGISELGKAAAGSRYHVFLSHFHWDHLQGLPFFSPAFDPSVALDFYSPRPGFEADLSGLMREPYSPVSMGDMPSKKSFRLLEGPVRVGPATVSFRKMGHPGGSFAYKVSHGGKRFIYATDSELEPRDFAGGDDNVAFFKGVDAIVLDSQYTLIEAIEKRRWGHSPYSMAVEFAMNWGIGHLVLFHHDPGSDDRRLHEMLRSARQYLRLIGGEGIEISLAVEGLEIVL
ncbi:MAG: MBL fold metallo-hydrolase [Treponema sp.]|nr:MBL fold metallo-hydrolase [Treponema sp.]